LNKNFNHMYFLYWLFRILGIPIPEWLLIIITEDEEAG